jgi:UDP-GlcNAc:undecaprenyl-phosphate GlcNAc-1-phosphate transferase
MMDYSLVIATLTFSMAFISNLLIIPLLIFLSHKYHIFDHVDERKIHVGNISRLGGIGIFISTMVIAVFGPILLNIFLRRPLFEFYVSPTRILVFAGVSIIFTIGVLDDFFNLSARYKLIGQIAAAALACASGALIQRITIPFFWIDWNLGYWSWPVTMIWIIGMTNAINLIDGMDGLAGGISLIAAGAYSLVFLLSGHYFEAIFCLTLVGALTGYLFYNFPPAKIFMGDSGALFLGYALSLIPLIAMPSSGTIIYLPFTMLLIPIIDVISAIIRRTRKRIHFFSPDREHIHHKLMDVGLSTRGTLAWVYSLTLMSACIMIFYYQDVYANARAVVMLFGWVLMIGLYIFLRETRKVKQKAARVAASEDSTDEISTG